MKKPEPGSPLPARTIRKRERQAIMRRIARFRTSAEVNGCRSAAEWLDTVLDWLRDRNTPGRRKSKQGTLELVPVEAAGAIVKREPEPSLFTEPPDAEEGDF